MARRNPITTTQPQTLSYAVGTEVRALSAPHGAFAGCIAVVRGYTRSGKRYALEFPGHPWQERLPGARWFFGPSEVEEV